MRDRRGRIIEAASELMARQGFQQTSIDEVIQRAGLCGKAHFYHYFKSKEALGYAVLHFQFESFTERGLTLLRDPVVPPLERLNRFIDAVVASHAEHGCQGGGPCCGNLVTEMADSHEGFRELLDVVFERWAAQIQALLWEARPELDEHVDIARLARFIIATLEGALLMSRVKREIGLAEGVAEELKNVVASRARRPIGAPDDTRISNGLHATESQVAAGPRGGSYGNGSD
ncbi:MAG TPA: TetR/AcrR family transcriptional regulator [Gemmatimonadaceae bacterium]|nr:TetR/AcrR family transcriptional regulator [Gemmatimonadaceae bacterium]